MDYNILKNEIVNDPLARGYSGMTDLEVATSLNTANRSRNRSSMTGSEIWENTDPTNFGALTDAKRDQWLSFCGISSVDPFGSAEDFVIYIFGAGTTTVQNLNAARVESISRATELALPSILESDVEHARTL